MTKKQAKFISELWNNQFAGFTDATRTKAVIEESCVSKNNKNGWSVEIVPDGDDNTGDAFYHTEELVDVARTFKVSSFIRQSDGKLVGRLY